MLAARPRPWLAGLTIVLALAPARSRAERPPALQRPEIRLNPSGRAPLAAVVAVVTGADARVEVEISDGVQTRVHSFAYATAGRHSLPILGLSPATVYSVVVSVAAGSGAARAWPEPLRIVTAALPTDFPPLRTAVSSPAEMEPGVTLFNVRRYEPPAFGLLVAVGPEGEVLWLFRSDDPIDTVTPLRSGNLLLLRREALTEIDWLGNIVQQWCVAGLGKDGIAVDVECFHHDVSELPDGGFLVLSTERRTLPYYPSS
jgi:hypothetical protein